MNGRKACKNDNEPDHDKFREQCGVLGVLCDDPGMNVASLVYTGLMALQHRGQEAAGIAVMRPGRPIFRYRDVGLVNDVLRPERITGILGNIALGHVRYGTVSSSTDVACAQPWLFESNEVNFAIAFNGTITNSPTLRKDFEARGHVFTTSVDTEVISHLIAATLELVDDWVEAIKVLMKTLDGSYAIIILTEQGDVYAFRDPRGYKPLCYGELTVGNGHETRVRVVASETCAIDALSGEVTGHVRPGEILHLRPTEPVVSEAWIPADRRALCQFEFVYFANNTSELDGISVYETRKRLGANLFKIAPVASDNAIVVPVPDSGRSAALGYAQASGLPLEEALIKNRYITRTFIMPGLDKRRSLVNLKLFPDKKTIRGRDIILIDDSIVRGTTTAKIVRMLKANGARSVHLRISCPPVRYPCFMGIDFPTRHELMASNHPVDEICRLLGADSLAYQTIDGLLDSIGLGRQDLCMACLDKVYPLKIPPCLEVLEETFARNRGSCG
ncbi:MAG: amidophosphoribosyltransferase [Candidatus Lokiarchaeota archaeon]|nr:amidophosphoribosyltransferase [Candidatus Lokiarchaeota archaeon]